MAVGPEGPWVPLRGPGGKHGPPEPRRPLVGLPGTGETPIVDLR